MVLTPKLVAERSTHQYLVLKSLMMGALYFAMMLIAGTCGGAL